MAEERTEGIARRDVLKLGATGLGVAAVGACTVPGGTITPMSVFSLGIASGLHSDSEIVLWTRLEPLITTSFGVDWEVATSPAFTTIVASGSTTASPLSDFTVKELVGGLSPDTEYWYRFIHPDETSVTGRARTIPAAGASPTSLKLAFASCQSYANGFYAAWRHIAQQDVDAVLFLGDYIYESSTIQTLGVVRQEPQAEAVTLQDYRMRYQLYKSDPDLQAAHAAHPFVPIWDDHEVANDYTSEMLVNSPVRVAEAYQTWFEYMPVWPISGTQTYRDYRWGDLAHLCMLDTRQYRDLRLTEPPILGPTALGPGEAAPDRTMLGATQKAWLLGALDQAQADGVPWKLIGNQVLMAPLRTTDLDTPSSPPGTLKHAGWYSSGLDTWDGYPVERDLILSHLDTAGIENTMFLTGDYHSFWQMTLTTDFDDPAAPKVANDFATGAISSAGGAVNELFMSNGTGNLAFFPPFNYSDMTNNGYGLVEATPSGCDITYYAMDAAFLSAVPQATVTFSMTPGVVDPVQTIH